MKEDVDRYVNQVKDAKGRGAWVLSKREAARMRKRQRTISDNYTYTKEDIEKLVEEKKKRKGIANIGLAKTKIEAEIKAAEAQVEECRNRVKMSEEAANDMDMDYDDDDEQSPVGKAKAALQVAEERLASRHKEKEYILAAEARRTKAMQQSKKIQDWERVNEQNRNENKNADFESYKERQAEAAARANKEEFNPFARRKVKPKLLWEVGGKADGEVDEKPETNQSKISENNASTTTEDKSTDSGKEN